MIDADGLIETFESRRRQLRMRLVLTVLIAGCYAHLVGWTFCVTWVLGYYLLQAIESRLVLTRAEDGRLPAWKVRAAFTLLFVNGVVFGSFAVLCTLTFGLWGLANGGFILAGSVLNAAMSNRSKTSFLVSLVPYCVYFPVLAALAWLALGVPWMSAFSLVLCGPLVIGPTIILWFEGARLRRDEEAAQRKRAEAEAANTAKDAFLAMMSHEIRTPLNGVLGMTWAMEQDELSPVQQERLRVIREAGQNLMVILDDILDLSKIGAGKLTLETVELDLEQVVRSACAPFLAIAEQKGLFLDLSISEKSAGCYLGDPTRLRQVISNLVSNAVKFTSEGGVRLLVFSDEAGSLSFMVTDTGAGMSPEQLASLFQPFTQADLSTTRKFGGTGLGLAITDQLVRAMGGRIEVKSRAGQGAAFTLHLPLQKLISAPLLGQQTPSEPPPAPAPVARQEPVPTAPAPATTAVQAEAGELRILAAEDNQTNQLVLRTLLAQAGLSVTMVSDGAAAVRAWSDSAWDLILMDVRMPVMDGPTATSEIRRQEAETGRRRTPIIALTANVMPHQVADYTRAGMDGLIPKPINVAALFGTIEAALNADAAAEQSAAAA